MIILKLFDSKSYYLFVRVQNHIVMFKHICEKYVYNYQLVSKKIIIISTLFLDTI